MWPTPTGTRFYIFSCKVQFSKCTTKQMDSIFLSGSFIKRLYGLYDLRLNAQLYKIPNFVLIIKLFLYLRIHYVKYI